MSLAAPENLTATVLSSTEVLLNWDAVNGATYHQVEKDGTKLSVADTSYVDNTFDGTETTYTVRGVLVEFDDVTFTVNITTTPIETFGPGTSVTVAAGSGPGDPPESLSTPQSFQVEQVGLDTLRLSWELLTPATHIDVEKDGAVTRITATTQYDDTGLSVGDSFDYRVRAVNTDADPEVVSSYTSLITGTIVSLGTPSPTVNVLSSTRIEVDWNEIAGATGYDAEIDGTVTSLGDFNSFLDAGLDPQQTRTYRVRALSGTTVGSWSSEVTGTTFRTVDLSFNPVLERQSYFPSNDVITANALKAEFDNIYALIEDTDPTPNTPFVPTDADMPAITSLTASRGTAPNDNVVTIDWSVGTWPVEITDDSRKLYDIRLEDTTSSSVFTFTNIDPDTDRVISGVPTDRAWNIRVRAALDSTTDPTAAGDYTATSVPQVTTPATEPEYLGADTEQGSDGTSHEFNLPAAAAADDHILVIAFIAPTDSTVAAGDTLATPPAGWTAVNDTAAISMGFDWADYRFVQPLLLIKKLTGGFSASETVTTSYDASVAFHVHHLRGITSSDLITESIVALDNGLFAPPSGGSDNEFVLDTVSKSGSGTVFLFGGWVLDEGSTLISPPVTGLQSLVMSVDGTNTLKTFSFVQPVTLPHTTGGSQALTFAFTPAINYTGILSYPYAAGYVG